MEQMALVLTAAAPDKLSVWSLILQAGLMVKFVILLLAAFSVVCWAIIGFKIWQLRLARKESKLFLQSFWAGESLEQVAVSTRRFRFTPLSQVFRAGMAELESIRRGSRGDDSSGSLADLSRSEPGAANLERTLRQAAANEMTRLSRFLSFLATTASAAPFIGLFGTIWGIMNSFRAIAVQKGAGIEAVGAGISEALIATAIGLAAAIPAVVAYNYFLAGLRSFQTELDNFQSEFMNIIERHFMKKRSSSGKKAETDE